MTITEQNIDAVFDIELAALEIRDASRDLRRQGLAAVDAGAELVAVTDELEDALAAIRRSIDAIRRSIDALAELVP